MKVKKKLFKSSKYWTLKEKQIVLKILRKEGHQDISKLQASLPRKTKWQITKFLKGVQKRASLSLRTTTFRKYNALRETHVWAPFIDNYCEVEPLLDGHLPARIIPFIEKYGHYSQVQKFGGINFQTAYRSIFHSLVNQPFPVGINDETVSMIYGSLNQLMQEARTEKVEGNSVLINSIRKRLMEAPQCSKLTAQNIRENESIMHLPEVNAFGWNSQEIQKLCRKN